MKVRLPVDATVLQRAAAIGKDSLLTNTFVDTSANETKYVTKRPGFLLGVGGVTNGTNYGVYINPNTGSFYYISSNGTPLLVGYFGGGLFGDLWNSAFGYFINSQVVYNDGTGNKVYYSATDNNTNNPPSSSTIGITPGNTFWSLQPFGPSRWFGRYRGSNGPTTGSQESAGFAAYSVFEPYKTCATQFPASASWAVYVGLGTIFNPSAQPNSILTHSYNDALSTPIGTCNATPLDLGISGSLGDVVVQLP